MEIHGVTVKMLLDIMKHWEKERARERDRDRDAMILSRLHGGKGIFPPSGICEVLITRH